MTTYRFNCIVCPVGCYIEVELVEGKVRGIRGHRCPRGEEWAREEALSPKRMVMTVLRVRGGDRPVVSVKTDRPIPKERVRDLMELLAKIELEAPLEIGQVVLDRPLGLDVRVVTTASVGRAGEASRRSDLNAGVNPRAKPP